MVPTWDDKLGILSVDGVMILTLNKPAECQRAILNAFQNSKWSRWIANPIKQDYNKDDRQRLADAVYKLNGRKKPIPLLHFRRDGQGKGVIWAWQSEN